jgi:pimeloyl-ACP methyl ester carboxylesterase
VSAPSSRTPPRATPRAEPTAAGRAKVGALEIAWETFGRDGDPVLLLVMGLGSQMVWWDADFCASLAARGFRVVRYDHRDIGLSSPLDELGVPRVDRLAVRQQLGLPVAAPYALDDMADDALGLLDALGARTAHVVGASMGGMIAQLLALRAPDRVESLCSWMSTPGCRQYSLPRLRAGLVLFRRPPPDLDGWTEFIVQAQRVIGSPAPLFDEHDVRVRAREALSRSRRRTGYARHLAAILAAPSRKASLAKLRMPALVLHGDRDPLVRPAAGKATAAAIPGARLEILRGVGHDIPRAIWPRVLDAIEGNASRRA